MKLYSGDNFFDRYINLYQIAFQKMIYWNQPDNSLDN